MYIVKAEIKELEQSGFLQKHPVSGKWTKPSLTQLFLQLTTLYDLQLQSRLAPLS